MKVNLKKRYNKMVDRIRWDTVSYLPFYYIFFSDWLSIFIINNFLFTSQNIGDKWHTLKPGTGWLTSNHYLPILICCSSANHYFQLRPPSSTAPCFLFPSYRDHFSELTNWGFHNKSVSPWRKHHFMYI